MLAVRDPNHIHVSGNKRLFPPLRIDFEVNKKRDRVFVEIGDGKKNEGGVQISRFYKEDFFKDLREENGWRPASAALRQDLEASRCRTRELVAHYSRGRPATLYQADS